MLRGAQPESAALYRHAARELQVGVELRMHPVQGLPRPDRIAQFDVQVDPRTPTTKNPPEHFTGDVWLDPIAFPRGPGQRLAS